MIVSPDASSGASAPIVESTNAAGTMTHRRHFELGDERRHVGRRLDALGRHDLDAVDVDVVADAPGPTRSSRRAMFAPMRPSPIMPSCIGPAWQMTADRVPPARTVPT